MYDKPWTTYTHGLGTEIMMHISGAKKHFGFTNQLKKHSYTNPIDLQFWQQLYDTNSHRSVYF